MIFLDDEQQSGSNYYVPSPQHSPAITTTNRRSLSRVTSRHSQMDKDRNGLVRIRSVPLCALGGRVLAIANLPRTNAGNWTMRRLHNFLNVYRSKALTRGRTYRFSTKNSTNTENTRRGYLLINVKKLSFCNNV